MTATTANKTIPYYTPSDPADIGAATQALAERVDTLLTGAWQTPALGNSWVDFDTAMFAATAYRKIDTHVRLRGMVKLGTLAAAIFTLPAGYRPPKTVSFTVMSNNATARVDVTAAGVVSVQAYGTGGSNAFVSLDQVAFFTD